MFEPTVRANVLRVAAPDARWLRTGPGGGFVDADAAYNATVPDGFDRTDLAAFAAERRRAAGFDDPGPTLLTGVDQSHARGARAGDVVAYATVGLSNPAALPTAPAALSAEAAPVGEARAADDSPPPPGTVNLLVGTTRSLGDGPLAELLGTVVEAKAATLLALAGVPGTTSDAAAVAAVPDGEAAAFAGSATAVGGAARACVREAIRAAAGSRYPGGDFPTGPGAADHGVATTGRAAVFDPADAA